MGKKTKHTKRNGVPRIPLPVPNTGLIKSQGRFSQMMLRNIRFPLIKMQIQQYSNIVTSLQEKPELQLHTFKANK